MSDAIADFVAARERLQQERAALLDRVAKLDELLCVVAKPSKARAVAKPHGAKRESACAFMRRVLEAGPATGAALCDAAIAEGAGTSRISLHASLSVMTSRGTIVRHRGADGRWIYSLPAKAVQS